MILRPSIALSYIEKNRADINHKFDQLRYVAETIIEMGYTEEDYGKYCKPLKITSNWQILSDLAEQLASFPEWINECDELIKILKASKSGHKKPNEKILKSASTNLIIKFGGLAERTPQETLEKISESRDNFNAELDKLKSICEALKKYGITDRDFWNEYSKNDHSTRQFTLVYLLSHNLKSLEEGAELVEVIKTYDSNHNKSWWDKMFRKKPKDETLQAMLNRLLKLYIQTTITW